MLILPPGHGQAVGAPPRLRTRERRLIAVVLLAVALLIIAVVIAFASTGRTSSAGCIELTYPGPVGAQELHQCGAQARGTCGSLGGPGAFSGSLRRAVAAECRKAGLRVGS